MLSITRIFRFEAAHSLSDYDGSCRNIHGHSYKLHLTVSGTGPKKGMLIDFKVLKKLVEDAVVNELDHALMLMKNEQNLAYTKNMITKVVWMDEEPTAEFLVYWMYHRIAPQLPDDVYVSNIRLFETENCYVDFSVAAPLYDSAG
ncbi:MAG: 6-carboxytetrahydropterin synthase [Bacteroidia bacterium]|jgi:6-pyruvoyltetrahydropterin/6-carboxytetrahydropterin synthase